MAGATLRAVPLRPPHFAFDERELAAAFSDKTRLFLLNTPHNPTGRVFTRAECETVLALCRKHDCALVTDEVYEHLTFEGHRHLSPAQFDKERTLRLSSAAKTFSFTGWKVGWACGPAHLTDALRRAHQFLVFSTAAPLQEAIAQAMEEAPRQGYYERFRYEYADRRALILDALVQGGFRPTPPEGTYFAMAAYSGSEDSDTRARRLIRERKVAAIPPASFYLHPEHGARLLRFAFCKRRETLLEVARHLKG
jgi:aspartate/methionine/tyrosine aminotransferase